jgi:hypothetical protein
MVSLPTDEGGEVVEAARRWRSGRTQAGDELATSIIGACEDHDTSRFITDG